MASMSKYHAPALDKGLDIIEYLSIKSIPQSQSEISQGIGKSPNEIYRMLVCLEQRGYLLKNAETGAYSLSLKLYQISHRHTPMDELLKCAKPIMEELSNLTYHSCHMSILYDGKLMVVAQNRAPGPVSLSIEEGGTFPLLKTNSGKVILANLTEEQLQQQLGNNKDYKTFSAKAKKDFLKELEDIKEKGYKLSASQLTLGVTDLAAPIGNIHTGVSGVLAISSLTNIAKEKESYEKLAEQLIAATDKINSAIGIMKTQLPK